MGAFTDVHTTCMIIFRHSRRFQDSTMANLLLAPVMRFLGRLSHPKLMVAFAALFVMDMFIPDPIPFVDEILFGLGTLLLANWKKRKQPSASGKQPIESESSRH